MSPRRRPGRCRAPPGRPRRHSASVRAGSSCPRLPARDVELLLNQSTDREPPSNNNARPESPHCSRGTVTRNNKSPECRDGERSGQSFVGRRCLDGSEQHGQNPTMSPARTRAPLRPASRPMPTWTTKPSAGRGRKRSHPTSPAASIDAAAKTIAILGLGRRPDPDDEHHRTTPPPPTAIATACGCLDCCYSAGGSEYLAATPLVSASPPPQPPSVSPPSCSLPSTTAIIMDINVANADKSPVQLASLTPRPKRPPPTRRSL